ncbi:MAG: ion transporter [Candidatus Hydrogenedentes bacterium]|nr:ion transporter [Candidatus Hydrogenedentota bacterium]
MVALICLNLLAIIVDSVRVIDNNWGYLFRAFEIMCVTIFTVEYVARIWSCTASPQYRSPIWGRLRFAMRPLILIDLVSILPFFLSLTTTNLMYLRLLRTIRVVRIARLHRYSNAMRLLAKVVRDKREELAVTFGIAFLILIISSCLMYEVENDAQPDKFSDIPATMWWSICTLTTVGYGDIYPVTLVGKLIAALVSIMGIGLFAIPAGIVGAAFVEQLKSRDSHARCPHCGEALGDSLKQN